MAWRSENGSRQYRRGNSRNIRANYSRFATERSGSVTLLLGLALVLGTGLMGWALDYSRGQLAHAQLQNADDPAGLAFAPMPKVTPNPVFQAEPHPVQ